MKSLNCPSWQRGPTSEPKSADECDGDRDGDGLDNAEDNCPDIPNGPSNISPTVDSAGFVRHWMTLGPFDGAQSAKTCLPTDVERLGDDASAEPAAGTKLLPEVQAYLDEHAIVRTLGEVVAELVKRPGVPDDRVGLVAAKLGLRETKSLLPLLDMPGFWKKESGAPDSAPAF